MAYLDGNDVSDDADNDDDNDYEDDDDENGISFICFFVII